MKHQKHKKLERPDWGNWGRNEWAIVGGKCSDIQKLSTVLLNSFSLYHSLYIDADHKSDELASDIAFDKLTNKIGSYSWQTSSSPNKYIHRPKMASYNLILVNGNHFQAKKQIVILDRDKEASLKKRIEQLTHIDLVLTHPNMENDTFAFLEGHLNNQIIKPTRLKLEDTAEMVTFLQANLQVAPLNALVLVGGQSQRMGEDKALIDYHGRPQFEHVYRLLESKVNEVYISCTPAQAPDYNNFQIIADSFDDLGPLGGILSAFRFDPNAAWLVVACDLPMVNEQTINQLITERNPVAAGTAFKSTYSEWMEPLIAIYEPSIYPTALGLLGQGYSCARKVMINAPVEIIEAKNISWLTNVNTQEEREAVTSK